MNCVDASEDLRLRLLGPVGLWRGAAQLPVGPPQRRAVLALLALAEGQPVSRDELVDALWPAEPPRSVTNVLQTHLKHLRRVLEPDRPARTASRLLPTVGTGYRLALDPAAVDLTRFTRLVAEVRAARAADDPARAWGVTGSALRLWRPPLADLPVLARHPRIAALTAEAQLVLSWRVDAAIRLGRAEEILATVREQARSRPLDEQAQAHLMRCYIALGWRADAFAVFDAVRRRLASELGVDPGPVLVEAHQDLLDPARSAGVADRSVGAPRTGSGAAVAAPVRRPAVPAQLPPEVGVFVGRAEHVRRLDELLAGPSCGRLPVAVVTGTAGVGKPRPGN